MKILHLRKIWFVFSAILAGVAIFGIVTFGLKTGIDFDGGQILETRFSESVDIEDVRHALEEDSSLESINIAPTQENTFILRSPELSEEQSESLSATLDNLGEWEEIRFETVGPRVSSNLTQKAIIGVALAILANILYIAWAFRRVPPPSNSWQFGIAAFISLSYNTLITIGVFSFLGHYLGFEVDALFITALLTVIGYSLNDTIVTFDRIRENLKYNKDKDFTKTVEQSLEQTVVRSLNTSSTLVLVLLAMLILGGSSLRPFVSALITGTIIGTYSSIFIASQILIVWPRNKQNK